jgi:hypothetical protein
MLSPTGALAESYTNDSRNNQMLISMSMTLVAVFVSLTAFFIRKKVKMVNRKEALRQIDGKLGIESMSWSDCDSISTDSSNSEISELTEERCREINRNISPDIHNLEQPCSKMDVHNCTSTLCPICYHGTNINFISVV